MRALRFYMHKNCMDVCIEVLKVQYYDDKKVKLKVVWVNLGYTGNPWPIDRPSKVLVIKRDDLVNWIDITDKMSDTRKEAGLPK